jgi:hypothetical protein
MHKIRNFDETAGSMKLHDVNTKVLLGVLGALVVKMAGRIAEKPHSL